MADVNMEDSYSFGSNSSTVDSTVEQSNIIRKLKDLSINSTMRLEDFNFDVNKHKFRNYAKRTMQGLKESNKDLYKLILNMQITKSRASLANELITDALNMFVKKLHVEFRYVGSMQKNLYVLPNKVFESKSLKELYACYCVINKPVSGKVIFLPILSLKLSSVTIGDDMMRNILSRCPLIEYLDISSCDGLTKISLSKMNHKLKHCSVRFNKGVFVDFFEHGLTVFPNLTLLEFDEVHLEKTFFHDSTVKFPCLTELSLCGCNGLEVVEVAIPSLKFIRVEGLMETRSVFNVPNIREFMYSGGTHVPSLCTNTFSKEWESSDIVFFCYKDLDRSWFLELQKFLQNLSASKKISLSFRCGGSNQVCIDKLLEEDMLGRVQRTPVDELVFEEIFDNYSQSLSAFSNLVNGLFLTCRPNLIELFNKGRKYPPRQQPVERVLPILEILGKSVTDCANREGDLKQVTYETYSKEVKDWRPIHWEDRVSLIHVQAENIRIRVRLVWQEGMN